MTALTSPPARVWLPLGRPIAVLAPVAAGLATTAVVLARDDRDLAGADVIRWMLVVAFVVAGCTIAREATMRRLSVIVLAGSVAGAVRNLAEVLASRGELVAVADLAQPVGASVVVALALHLLLALPEGRLGTGSRRNIARLGYVAAAVVGFSAWRSGAGTESLALFLFAGAAFAAGMVAANRRYHQSRGLVRQQLQWLGVALALVAETALLVVALRFLVAWPPAAPEVVASSLCLVPLALMAASSPRWLGLVDRLLGHAVSLAALSGLIVGVYLVVVVGLGRVPTTDERSILVLSMIAAGVSAALYVPARERLSQFVDRLVYGEGVEPTHALDTFGARMTRALPMDELLLQLVELLHRHLGLAAAEVWTGAGGLLERAASVPERGPAQVRLGDKELPVVTRAGVSARRWASVWLPSLVEGRGDVPLRVVPMTHSGELFGLIVVERHAGDEDFTEEHDRVLTELARQVGLALKNTELDTALQASLAELETKAVELQESRARIVATGDAERRKIERNLHDGAQQHLVALAVKLRMIQQLGQRDAEPALAMLDEARQDVQATVEALRTLAHGIYPPLLVDKGLPEALQAAAARAPLATAVTVDSVGRYPTELEAAVYFCCLEALQNAGKHAGSGARVVIDLRERDGMLLFEVADDGAGFDLAAVGGGHGLANMADRLGAMGGAVELWSAPGQGTRVSGRVPLPSALGTSTSGDPAPA